MMSALQDKTAANSRFNPFASFFLNTNNYFHNFVFPNGKTAVPKSANGFEAAER